MKPSQLVKSPTTKFFALCVALVLVLASMALFWGNDDNSRSPAVGETTPAYEAQRAEYETALLQDPNRLYAEFATYIVGTELYFEESWASAGYCEYRCMTVKEVEGGYAVTLPVAFNYSPRSTSAEPFHPLGNIVELTYWDPQDHEPKTVTAKEGETVHLPAVLYDIRHVEDLAVGDVAYTSAAYVRWTDDGPVVLDRMSVGYEHSGELYGFAPLVRLERTENDFLACLPAGYDASDIVYGTPGPDIPEDRTIIFDHDATGHPVRLLEETC